MGLQKWIVEEEKEVLKKPVAFMSDKKNQRVMHLCKFTSCFHVLKYSEPGPIFFINWSDKNVSSIIKLGILFYCNH